MFKHDDTSYKELLKDLPTKWKEFVLQEAMLSDPKALPVDWRKADPLPPLILNSCVQWISEDETEVYAHKSNVWVLFKKDGTTEVIDPEETSGVIYAGEDKRIVQRFDSIPQTVPADVVRAIRINLGALTDARGHSYGVEWHLYAIKH